MINQVEIFLFILTIITTALFTVFVRKVLLLADISDNPIISEHRSKTGTPTMGGFGIILGMLLITVLTINMMANTYLIITTLMMVVGGFFGAFDDLIGFKIKEYQKVVLNTGTTHLQIGKLKLGPGEEARITSDKAKEDYKY